MRSTRPASFLLTMPSFALPEWRRSSRLHGASSSAAAEPPHSYFAGAVVETMRASMVATALDVEYDGVSPSLPSTRAT